MFASPHYVVVFGRWVFGKFGFLCLRFAFRGFFWHVSSRAVCSCRRRTDFYSGLCVAVAFDPLLGSVTRSFRSNVLQFGAPSSNVP